MEWNLNARSDWDWEIEIPKSLAVSSHENGDYSYSGVLDSSCKDRGDVVELGFSDMVQEASLLSGEAMIGLKLGRETYCQERGKTMSSSCLPIIKRSRVSYQSSNVPRCQVEGCNLDLGLAKDYHRRHRICADHSKSPKVVVAGMERRFCQQCSRLHDLSEFDDRKRSCRRRLSAHNARRRRPQSEDNKFSSTYLRAHTGFLVNGVSSSSPNSTPQSSSNMNDAGVNMMPNGVLLDISSSFLGFSINHDGLEANCNSVYNTMEVGHSFSLAPTSSWGFSGRDEPSSFDHFIPGHNIAQFGTSLEMQNIHNPQIPPHDFECFCSD